MAAAPAGGEVDRRPPGCGVRGELYAGARFRAASGRGCERGGACGSGHSACRCGSRHVARPRSSGHSARYRGSGHAARYCPNTRWCARRSASIGGLSVPERLASGRPGRAQPARDGLDLRGRIYRRLELVAQHVGRRVRQAGRGPRCDELPRGAIRLLRASGVEPRASRREQGQLRLHGPDRRLAVGEAEHRRLRRQSEQRHHLRVFRGRRVGSQHAGVAAGARAVSQSHRRVRRLQGQRAHRQADE